MPAAIASSTVPAFSASATVCPSSSSFSSRSRTSLTRTFSSPSSRRTSPMRSPRSFSTTWSSMREKILQSMTTPSIPGGTLSEESFTSFAFSPKIAVSSFSSGDSSVSPLGVILPTRMSPGLHVRADAHDAALIEVHQRLLGDVRDLARDLLLAALGVADVQLELLDVDRRVDVVLDQALGEDDGILEVVPVPRHERDEHVRAERELAELGAGAVGEDVAGLDLLAELDDRALVDGGVLVGAPVLLDAVAVLLREALERHVAALLTLLRGAGIDEDLVGGHAGDGPGAFCDDHGAGVARDDFLETRAHQRRLRVEERHALALHVGTHQRAVRVVVLEERNERGGDRDELFRRDIHVIDARGRDERHVALLAAEHELVDERPVVVELGVRLRDDRVLLLVGVEPLELVRDACPFRTTRYGVSTKPRSFTRA